MPLLVPAVPSVTEPANPPAAPAASSAVPPVVEPYLPPSIRPPEPLVLLNSRFIGGMDISQTLRALSVKTVESVKKVRVYKGEDAPLLWRSLAANGVVDIVLKRKIRVKSWTFAQLGHRLGLKGPVSYFINGLPMADGRLRIARQAIGEIKVTRIAAGTILAIKTLEIPVKVYGPADIIIRGISAP